MSKRLNKFEECRLLSARALELAEGDKANVDVDGDVQLSHDCARTAAKEMKEGKLELEIYK